MKCRKQQEIADSLNEFEFEGKKYIAINVDIRLEQEEQCRQQCAFARRCKTAKPRGVPFCDGEIRADGLDVCFVEKGGRFRPRLGQKYWVATADGRPQDFSWNDDWMDKMHLEHSNTFPSRERAQEACDKIAALLERMRAE